MTLTPLASAVVRAVQRTESVVTNLSIVIVIRRPKSLLRFHGGHSRIPRGNPDRQVTGCCARWSVNRVKSPHI